jgi:hypothetical protein
MYQLASRFSAPEGPVDRRGLAFVAKHRRVALFENQIGGETVSTRVEMPCWRAAGFGDGVKNIRNPISANDNALALAA